MNVREIRVSYQTPRVLPRHPVRCAALSSPRDAADFLGDLLSHETVEVFIILCLTTKHGLIGYHEVSRGTLDQTLVHPRDIFKAAILSNAASIILAHNHPSGDPTPSAEDRALTSRLSEAGQLMGIEVLDHIVVGVDTRYCSFKETGLLS